MISEEMGKRTEQTFLEGRNPKGYKKTKKCSTFLAIKEMQCKSNTC
jgi:hypothetical protein